MTLWLFVICKARPTEAYGYDYTENRNNHSYSTGSLTCIIQCGETAVEIVDRNNKNVYIEREWTHGYSIESSKHFFLFPTSQILASL